MRTPSMRVAADLPATAPADPVGLFLAGKRSVATRRAYAADLRDFFGGEPRPQQVGAFLALPAAELTLRLFTYKAELVGRGAAEATVNRRLSAVRSLLRFAHRLGLAHCDGRGLVEGEKVRPSGEREQLDAGAMKRLVAAPERNSLRGLRDVAILRLLCESALRRSELCALNVADFSSTDGQLLVPGQEKGDGKESLPLSRRSAEAVAAYLAAAGHEADPAAPLFRNLDHRPGVAGERLTADGLYFLVREYGRKVGLEGLTPHQLRRSAIAAALEAAGPKVRRALRLSRHQPVLSQPVGAAL